MKSAFFHRILHPKTGSLKVMAAALALGAATALSTSAGLGAEKVAPVDFGRDIRPILSANCFHCHGPDEGSRKAKLRLDLREEATRDRDGIFAIAPGKPVQSELIRRITTQDEDDVMPPPKTGHHLTPQEAALLQRWIEQGAVYSQHWAFVPPQKTTPPPLINKVWPRNAIDHFIYAKLKRAGLSPSPLADRSTLIRRLSLDLTGLPPTPQEVQAFVRDPSEKAYEKLVDRLLASPAYGERWARSWLDLARYADSAGYGSDPLRLNIWPWRDWVIQAFNRNQPFDQFSLDQLAGDLLPNPTQDQLIATAFHRNTMNNTEGGTDDEEYRVAAVKDRVNVTVQSWMGLTMGCAQCHTHKFDPISHKEYYQFFALFNQSEDSDKDDDRPTLSLPSSEQKARRQELLKQLKSVREELAQPGDRLQDEFISWQKDHARGTPWTILTIHEAKTTSTARLVPQADASVLATGPAADRETYTLSLHHSLTNLSALRLELLPDNSLPGQGPGRSTNGQFALNQLQLFFKPEGSAPRAARFVRITLPGDNRMLALAEVEVMSLGTNVARTGKASQSSTDYQGPARLAIDGNTNGDFDTAKSTTHTRGEANPWWEVDLGSEMLLEEIKVWNRTDNNLTSRLDGFQVQALDAGRKPVWNTTVRSAPPASVTLAVDGLQQVPLQNPSADFQAGNPGLEPILAATVDPKKGWSTGPGDGRPHELILETSRPLPPGTLVLRLEQNGGPGQSLGRLRLSATSAATPVRVVPAEIQTMLAQGGAGTEGEQRTKVIDWFSRHAHVTRDLTARQSQLNKDLADIKPVGLPIMRELAADKARVSHRLNKGNFLDPAETLSPAVLGSLHPMPAHAPTNRLGMALWLVSPENPLTARVTVNRFWSQLFGTGLVETEEDFGTQGQLPSHPELLDWLAIDFRDHGWDMKRLLKTMVMSATYQQRSKASDLGLARDPRNRLLWRFPRQRLEAELIRDQALALGGLLSHKIGGPSVYPPQPDGLWRAAFNGQRTYPTSTGEDRYRRGLYTLWRRTVPYPSMATFDAPSRESCTLRRLPTNTPLQAYVTLNDPVYLEAAQALARRILREGGSTVEDRLHWAYRLVTARRISRSQLDQLKKLHATLLADFTTQQAQAIQFATLPLGPLPENLAPAEAAAWTAVANVLLNLDSVLTRN